MLLLAVSLCYTLFADGLLVCAYLPIKSIAGDACPGFGLHFWRKQCTHCKCSPAAHVPPEAQSENGGLNDQAFSVGRGNRQVGKLNSQLLSLLNGNIAAAQTAGGHGKQQRGKPARRWTPNGWITSKLSGVSF